MFFCANARSFWGVVAGEHCRDGLPAFFMFFCANARSFWGVAAMDYLSVMFFCVNAWSFWGVASGEHCSDGLPACYVFCVNARSFWGVAVGEHRSDGLPAFFCVLFARMCGLRQVITTFWYGLLYCTCNPMSKSLFPEIRTSITITSINNN